MRLPIIIANNEHDDHEGRNNVVLTCEDNVPFILQAWVRRKLSDRFFETSVTYNDVYQSYIDSLLAHLVNARIIDFWNDRWVIFQPECLFRWVKS